MKGRHLLGIGIIFFFLVFSIVTFKSSLTPYVSFAEARTLHSNSIQIRGMLVADSLVQVEKGRVITFVLRDDNAEQVTVLYRGVRPDGFEQASSIVAMGKYQDGSFNAEKLLVKCPSKYQGAQGRVNKR